MNTHMQNSVESTVVFARNIRLKSVLMVHRAQASHIGSALSMSDIIAVIFGAVMRFDPKHPEWSDRDRFILSKGHACVAVYAGLAELGFFELTQLDSYGVDHSNFMAHISHKVPGVEFSTGSLGHGMPFGVGKALAAKMLGQSWRTFIVLGDGELDEGSNWEAAMFASHHKLDNIVVIIDYNKLQSLTTVAMTIGIEPLVQKFEAFGWCVREADGHDHCALTEALSTAPWQHGKPSILIAHTIKGKGVSYMENSVAWHYRSPSNELMAQALHEINNNA